MHEQEAIKASNTDIIQSQLGLKSDQVPNIGFHKSSTSSTASKMKYASEELIYPTTHYYRKRKLAIGMCQREEQRLKASLITTNNSSITHHMLNTKGERHQGNVKEMSKAEGLI